MIFFNVVQIFATSKLWPESVYPQGILCIFFTLFLNNFCVIKMLSLFWGVRGAVSFPQKLRMVLSLCLCETINW